MCHNGDEQAIGAHRRSLALALAAGVSIAAGSDMAPRPHVDLLTELALLSRAGLAVDDLPGRVRAVWRNGSLGAP
ncbi:hypothetical protein [Qaidamihabitans albus]|uniref:hypothetical protein n=1 Tax=Qaidamihabitans albus TaxID=2795733 RepID=UPI0018F25FE7|nr:hypothetical protein [Qaidamihabitans albus]